MDNLKNIIKKSLMSIVLAGSLIGCTKEEQTSTPRPYEKGKVIEKSDRGDYFMLHVENKNKERYVLYVHPQNKKPLELARDIISVGSRVIFCTDYTSKWGYTHMGKKAYTMTMFADDIDVVPDNRDEFEKFIDADY